jgi:undecaprenyl-diphosphatase
VRSLIYIVALGVLLPLGQAAGPAVAPPEAPAAELSIGDAVILGLVEGVTEFLPISSTGHLIIATHTLGLESQQPLTGRDGRPLWYKKPSARNPAGEPLTPKLAADTYIVVIQVGAILAVVLLYWGQLASMVQGLIGRDSAGLRLLRNLFCAFLPVAVVGLVASKWIERHLFSIGTVIIGLVGGALLMFIAERRRRHWSGIGREIKDPADLNASQALGIGLMQCLALWPGTSRSMVTIVGGYFTGLTPAKSAEFSFLVGLPVLAGAAFIKGLRSGPAMIEVFGWANVLLGIIVAAVSAAAAVKFLVAFLTRQGLTAFAIYRLVLAVLLAAVFYL